MAPSESTFVVWQSDFILWDTHLFCLSLDKPVFDGAEVPQIQCSVGKIPPCPQKCLDKTSEALLYIFLAVCIIRALPSTFESILDRNLKLQRVDGINRELGHDTTKPPNMLRF